MSIFSTFRKKPPQDDDFEQKLREFREQEIQSYEANLPRENDKTKTNQNQDA